MRVMFRRFPGRKLSKIVSERTSAFVSRGGGGRRALGRTRSNRRAATDDGEVAVVVVGLDLDGRAGRALRGERRAAVAAEPLRHRADAAAEARDARARARHRRELRERVRHVRRRRALHGARALALELARRVVEPGLEDRAVEDAARAVGLHELAGERRAPRELELDGRGREAADGARLLDAEGLLEERGPRDPALVERGLELDERVAVVRRQVLAADEVAARLAHEARAPEGLDPRRPRPHHLVGLFHPHHLGGVGEILVDRVLDLVLDLLRDHVLRFLFAKDAHGEVSSPRRRSPAHERVEVDPHLIRSPICGHHLVLWTAYQQADAPEPAL